MEDKKAYFVQISENKEMIWRFSQDRSNPNADNSKEYKCPTSGCFKSHKRKGFLRGILIHLSDCYPQSRFLPDN